MTTRDTLLTGAAIPPECEEPCPEYGSAACQCGTPPAPLPEHSGHGASSCKRWWNCPGSVALSRTLPNEESEYAKEGTRAHALAALCLENHQDAAEYVGRFVLGVEIDAAMAEHVQVYIDQCRIITRWTPAPCVSYVEKRFNLAALSPPAPMYGTADFVAVAGGTLYVVDLKYGAGVQVQAIGNPQLRYYALGALLATGAKVDHIKAMIVQPRAAGGGAIRTDDIDPIDLMEWSVELLQRAAATLVPDAPLAPGDWCSDNFCAARGSCKARKDAAQAVAGMEFVGGKAVAMVDPRLLTPEQKAAALDVADMLTDWVRDLRAAATADISRGPGVPGWKLVPTKAQTRFRSTVEADAALDNLIGEARWAPRELLSYAQARDALAAMLPGKNAKVRKEAAAKALAGIVTSTSSGTNLVPDTDARPAIPTGGAEFLP